MHVDGGDAQRWERDLASVTLVVVGDETVVVGPPLAVKHFTL